MRKIPIMIASYERAKVYSEENIQAIRKSLAEVAPADCIITTFGSYARREASSESDIDYLIIERDTVITSDISNLIHEAIKLHVKKDPANGGPFGKAVIHDDILKNLGGKKEDNESFTRRLLLLLEGEHLFGEAGFEELRRKLIERYVSSTPKDHQLTLFLLNDIIRYWRTMTVDYMYKTTEDAKPWAIRNIKLIFSRKLLYASGLFAVGATVDKGKSAKVDLLKTLFDLTPIDRLVRICGEQESSAALSSYDQFLRELEKPAVRTHLEGVPEANHDDRIFRDLKNEGHVFTRELLKLFEATFHSTHPIHRAVVF